MSDGTSGLTDQQLQDQPEESVDAQATMRRNNLVHTLGNLTLLRKALNSAQSNACWADKRPELLRYSLLPINLQLAQNQEWNEDAIGKRGEMLFEHALEIWPR